jgi:hypothetical protein
MSYKIHPGIGVGCVGNSLTDWHIAPETIEIPPPPPGGYRDAEGRIKPLGARFRVFEYDDVSGAVLGEVNASTGHEIRWEVGVAPRWSSAATQVIVGAHGARDLVQDRDMLLTLGELRTDGDGRLIVLARITPQFDGSCDGWVRASVTRSGGVSESATSSWVVMACPDFAPGRRPVVSFYDRLYQLHVNRSSFPLSPDPIPSFRRDIFPLLRARNRGRPLAVEAAFPALGGYSERYRAANINLLLDPLPGAEYVGDITVVQFRMLKRWVQGIAGVDWIDDWPGDGDPLPPATPTADELDRGPLSQRIPAGSADLGTSMFEPTAFASPSRYLEAFRFVADPPFGSLLPSAAWREDLGTGCPALELWGATFEAPGAVGAEWGLVGNDWETRGFMVLGAGSALDGLNYVEAVHTFYILQLTHAIDFHEVPRGPGGARHLINLPITFEVQAGALDVQLVFTTPPPAGLHVGRTTEVVPAGEARTVQFWVTYDTDSVTSPLSEVVEIRHLGGLAYHIPVRGTTGMPATTKLACVLDISGSMNLDRGDGISKLRGLQDAFGVLVDYAVQGTGIGVVAFNDDAIEPFQPIIPVGITASSDPARRTLSMYVRDRSAGGGTSIGDGLTAAHRLLAGATGYTHEAILVITDGKETSPEYIENVADRITARTYALGIGRSTDVDVRTLQILTGNRGGYLLVTGDPVSAENVFRLDKYLTQIVAGIRNEDVIIDPEASLLPGAVTRIGIPVTEAELSLEAIVICDQPKLLDIALQAPDGEVLSRAELTTRAGAAFVEGSRVNVCRVELPLEASGGVRHQGGEWSLLIAASQDGYQGWPARLAGEPKLDPQARPIRYAAVVTTRSSIKMQLSVQQPQLTPGSPVLIEATLSELGGPLRGAKIKAEISHPDGTSSRVELDEAEPGRYLGRYEPVRPGDYQLRVRALGHSIKGYRFQRELSATAPVLAQDLTQGGLARRPCASEDGRAEPPWRRLLSELAACLSRAKREG